jgi:hypothetical protein
MSEDRFPEGVEVIPAGDGQGRGGFYNMLIPGGFERGEVLLPLLGGFETFSQLGRFRDIWVEKDADGQLHFHLYTRNGGGNRPAYEEAINRLRAHPLFERDADDSLDSTYASFWFRVPPQHCDLLREIATDPVDTGERWKAIIASVSSSG